MKVLAISSLYQPYVGGAERMVQIIAERTGRSRSWSRII